MKKLHIFFIGFAVLVCLFLLFAFNTSMAFAQEDDIATTTIDAISEKEAIEKKELPADVALDEKITTEDLGAVEAGVLPGSPLHIFKRFGWTIQEIFETDPVVDAELKIKHANQELSELKQLIDEKGLSDVNSGIINASMKRFEERLDNVNNVAESLKQRKEDDPEAVDSLLNNLTDKQFKYQKVLESIERSIIKEKEENPDANNGVENVFVKISETKDKTLEHFGKVLGTVEGDNQERMAERIIKVADKQEGSEFKHLKNLEILKRLEGQVPASAKEAIALAQENTLKFFSRDIASLPEEDRAGRFEQYSRFSYGDETRQLSFLDDLKLLDDVPPEILKKIEEVKNFAITKFEKKMSGFKQPNVLESYVGYLSGENFNDIVLTEQLASRAVFENNPEIKKRMDDIRNKSVQEFTNRFTDSESASQVNKFQELEKLIEERPGDPKIMKMMQELETQVRNDPTKAAFLDQISQLEDKMRFEFEEKFRQEGDGYFDRIGTLDPRDFEAYQQFSGENFLPADLAEKFLEHGVGQYRDYMMDVDDPEQFDRFNSKFSNVPQLVIDEIKQRDAEFGEAMQFKRQVMEKLRFEQERQFEIDRSVVDYKEREIFHQLDRARKQADEEFWRKLNSIPYEKFDERKALFEEKRQADLARLNEEHNTRLELFNKRLELDPWCDSACREIQKQFIEQEFRHQKERIQDDYISNQKRIEFDLSREKENNPLFGLCNTPESCDTYCQNNLNVEACKVFFHEPAFLDDFGPKDYDCGLGKYFDFSINGCAQDPYYIPPKDFTQCKTGTHWNKEKGFCEQDYISPVQTTTVKKIDCGPDAYFEFRENKCISYRIGPTCPDIAVMFPAPCPDGQYRDIIMNNSGCKTFGQCVGDSTPSISPSPILPVGGECGGFAGIQCPQGYRCETPPDRADAFGTCVPDGNVTCNAYFEGYEYNPTISKCEFRSISGCNNPFKYKTLTECQNGNVTGSTSSKWINHAWYFSDGSFTSSSILNRTDAEYLNYIASIEAQCKNIPQSSFVWKKDAGNDASWNWQNFGIPDCSGTGTGTGTNIGTTTANYWCGNNICDLGENIYSCSIDCGGTSTYGDCKVNNTSNSCYAQPGCKWFSDSSGTYCEGDNFVPPSNTGGTYVGDSGCENILDILPGCHLMSESPNVRFNTAMDQYIEVGARTIQYCSANSIPGCTSYYSSATSEYCGNNVCGSGEDSFNCSVDCGSGASSSGMQKCFYPNATINGAPTGYTVWCESDYYNCHEGDPSGASVGLNNLSLGAPSFCESGYSGGSGNTTSSGYCGDNWCGNSETALSCPSDCGGSGSTYCPSPSYWDSAINGCASGTDYTTTSWCGDGTCDSNENSNSCWSDCGGNNSSTTYCPPPSYWDYAINGCNYNSQTVSCMTANDYGYCENGYDFDSNGCVIGCVYIAPIVETVEPASVIEEPTPVTEELPPATEEEIPPVANVWKAFKALFGF